jgi:hypothetical protein
MTDEFLGNTPTQNRIDSPSTYLGFSRRRTGWTPAAAPGDLAWVRDAGIGELPMSINKSPTTWQMKNRAQIMEIPHFLFD